MTGCMRVSKESIFTGLNNFTVFSCSDVEFDEYFGFTDEELKENGVGKILRYGIACYLKRCKVVME